MSDAMQVDRVDAVTTAPNAGEDASHRSPPSDLVNDQHHSPNTNNDGACSPKDNTTSISPRDGKEDHRRSEELEDARETKRARTTVKQTTLTAHFSKKDKDSSIGTKKSGVSHNTDSPPISTSTSRDSSTNRDSRSSTKGKGTNNTYAAIKEQLKEIAASTLDAIDEGSYECDGKRYQLRDTVDDMIQKTEYYPPESELKEWRTGGLAKHLKTVGERVWAPLDEHSRGEADVSLSEQSTLEGARYLYAILDSLPDEEGVDKRIGVLNFASAKKPGGGFINGARAQEESIARSSTLYASLMIDVAQKFYELHNKDPRQGYYTHAMIYSPGVQLLKDDTGNWLEPIAVDVLTSPAVNAGIVRRDGRDRKEDQDDAGGSPKDQSNGEDSKHSRTSKPRGKWSWKSASKHKRLTDSEIESAITRTMYERMARLLYLFELQGVKNLVLGSFGTGVFQNKVDIVASLWVELVMKEGARFRWSFDRVLFAVIGDETFKTFQRVFGEKKAVGDGRPRFTLDDWTDVALEVASKGQASPVEGDESPSREVSQQNGEKAGQASAKQAVSLAADVSMQDISV
ncbi:hypothetical protein CC1G_06809 [Coprinopsis cinerea okayama7|uniref:Microbial-type PARG catalytic domain-containing protein n=1 Tax=Coprinopsis cinerea (strain Okayama-7 / 130 / ATCC MYA-4618 / FGSC 9003) TaxID=240176 RepID=A8N1K0_COPC7|nr:hypothetical protein CC1G_06809 [Coprinopsis cinerea okayama7\|eukprot:XP_001828823.1 hypothetical protein CC1G_06809 [Coprinopsis cinerea okayama7\